MVLSSATLANGRFHETRQRRQYVNWRVDTLVVQLTVNEDLTLGDITRQIGNRMRDICGGRLASLARELYSEVLTVVRHG